jgi:hypothetical protein
MPAFMNSFENPESAGWLAGGAVAGVLAVEEASVKVI